MRIKSIWGPEQQETQQQKWEKGKEKILNSLSTSRPTNKNLSFFVFLYLKFNEGTSPFLWRNYSDQGNSWSLVRTVEWFQAKNLEKRISHLSNVLSLQNKRKVSENIQLFWQLVIKTEKQNNVYTLIVLY